MQSRAGMRKMHCVKGLCLSQACFAQKYMIGHTLFSGKNRQGDNKPATRRMQATMDSCEQSTA